MKFGHFTQAFLVAGIPAFILNFALLIIIGKYWYSAADILGGIAAIWYSVGILAAIGSVLEKKGKIALGILAGISSSFIFCILIDDLVFSLLR